MILFDPATARDVLDAFRVLEGRLQGSGRRLSPGAQELISSALRSVRVSEVHPLASEGDVPDDDGVLLLLTYADVADRLQVSVSTVKRIVRRGDLCPVRVNGAVRFRPSDINDYIAG